jgi:probable metal-binding protein
MRMIIASGRAWSRDELIAAIEKEFGADAHFHTCSANDMNAEEMIRFLEKRGKLTDSGAGLTTSVEHICDH